MLWNSSAGDKAKGLRAFCDHGKLRVGVNLYALDDVKNVRVLLSTTNPDQAPTVVFLHPRLSNDTPAS